MEKRMYTKPAAHAILFSNEDILTKSGTAVITRPAPEDPAAITAVMSATRTTVITEISVCAGRAACIFVHSGKDIGRIRPDVFF